MILESELDDCGLADSMYYADCERAATRQARGCAKIMRLGESRAWSVYLSEVSEVSEVDGQDWCVSWYDAPDHMVRRLFDTAREAFAFARSLI